MVLVVTLWSSLLVPDLISSSISGGADGDSLVFSAVVKSNTSIAGGGGADTMVFNDSIGAAYVSLIAVLIPSASSPRFLVPQCTAELVFRQSLRCCSRLVSFDGVFGGGFISLAGRKWTVCSSSGASVTGTTVEGTGDADQVVLVMATTLCVQLSNRYWSSGDFGSNADLATFNQSGSIYLRWSIDSD